MNSVILPVYNEEACLEDMISRVEAVLKSLGGTFEIICVDDHSCDASWAIIEKLHKVKPVVKGIRFSRNFGHQLAVFAGIKHCRGDYIAVLDADGQDPPEFLAQMFTKCKEGFDVVYAVRKKRKENIFKRAAYTVFYRIYRSLASFEVPLDAGDFAVFTKPVAEFIQSLNEKQPFIRGLRSWYGGRQCGIEYEREKRHTGKSKYNFYRLLNLAINASVSFSKLPLRFISLIGILASFIGLGYGIFTIIRKLTIGINLVGWASTVSLIVFFGGLNLFVLGIIGEYIGHIFDEVKNRPSYLIEKKID